MTDPAKYSAAGNRILPNTFQHPNIFIDKLMYYLSPEENTVLTFAVRRILGFQDNISSRKDNISLSQFTDGLKDKSGNQLCYGCGLRPAGVRSALDALEKYRVLLPTTPLPDPRRGQEYWLQEDQDAIDWPGLLARIEEKKAQESLRTLKARSSVAQNPSVPQKARGAVGQKARGLSDRDTKPIETQGKKNGAQPAPIVETSVTDFGLDWQLLAVQNGTLKVEDINIPITDGFDLAKAKDIANLIDMKCSGAGPLAMAFMVTRQINFTNDDVKGQCKAARYLLEKGVKPEHVIGAVSELMAINYKCINLFHATVNAVALANPAPLTSNERVAAETY